MKKYLFLGRASEVLQLTYAHCHAQCVNLFCSVWSWSPFWEGLASSLHSINSGPLGKPSYPIPFLHNSTWYSVNKKQLFFLHFIWLTRESLRYNLFLLPLTLSEFQGQFQMAHFRAVARNVLSEICALWDFKIDGMALKGKWRKVPR